MIKAVIFDIDGVLVNSFEANFTFFKKFFEDLGYTFPDRDGYNKIFHLTMPGLIEAITGVKSKEEIKKIFDLGRAKFNSSYPHHLVETPKDEEYIIDILSKKYLLALVTSRFYDAIYSSPQLTKLKDKIKVTVSYESTEKHKPDPEPLLSAAEKLGFKPEECVYIGDAKSDATAAKDAHMKVVIYNTTPFEDADINTSDFSKIPEIIEKLS